MYAKRIDDSQLTGLVDVSVNPPKVFCYCSEEVANVILKNKTKSEKWDKLDEKIGKYYNEENESTEEEEGSLLDIGEAVAGAFGYL